ncbi:MAG TPA: hypothetical protein ENJ44_05855 [Oceanospirillales bacterium]|nr:hypothetical protein [Oceanospirillales bacterium]
MAKIEKAVIMTYTSDTVTSLNKIKRKLENPNYQDILQTVGILRYVHKVPTHELSIALFYVDGDLEVKNLEQWLIQNCNLAGGL